MTRKVTITILICITLILVGWDVWVFIEPTQGDTISEVTFAFAQKHPVLAFVLGVICGHCLWGQKVYVVSDGNRLAPKPEGLVSKE